MGFSPGKTAPRGIALKGRPRSVIIPKDNVRRKRLDGVSEAHEALGAPADLLYRRQHAQSDVKGTEPLHTTAYIYVVVNAISDALSGRFPCACRSQG
jgi:hypothetical protein